VASGIRSVLWCGRGVNAADFDDDGDLDIFVANYRLNPDLLWVNTGNATDGTPLFVNQASTRGVEGRMTLLGPNSYYGHSIGAAWGDLDRDGFLDLVVARLAHSAWLCFSDITGVYRSSGTTGYTFENRREAAGVSYNEVHAEPSLVDFDNDGRLDLHITQAYDGWRSSTYHARGTGPIAFDDVTHLSGIWPRSGWGSGWADYDNDGDMDLAAQGLWRNREQSAGTNHWLQVAAAGCYASNRDAIGAKVRIQYAGTSDRRDVVGGRGTGSQDSPIQHFGLGASTAVNHLEVAFPSGQIQIQTSVTVNQRLRVVEVGGRIVLPMTPVMMGRPVQLTVDTCGVVRDVGWDLDSDGAFDDGSGAPLTVTFDHFGPVTVAAQISGAGVSRIAYAVVEVQSGRVYLPLICR